MATMEIHEGDADDSESCRKILETLRAPFCVATIDRTDEDDESDALPPFSACLIPFSDTLRDDLDVLDADEVESEAIAIGEGTTENAAVDNLASVLVRRFTEIAADLSKKFALQPKGGA